MVIGIDASRNRSGGAQGHLVGILRDGDPPSHGITTVHVWSYRRLLDALPNAPWLVKHNPEELERSLLHQVRWQYGSLPKEANANGCRVLLNTDAGSVCRFRPAVVMSRDMLSYEPGEINRYGFSKARVRLILLRLIQNSSLRRADGAIFLTEYAARVIQQATGKLKRVAIIPHGVGDAFRLTTSRRPWPTNGELPIRCLYVSNTAPNKHQWVVVQAFGELRKRGHNVLLQLVGGGSGKAQVRLEEEIGRTDPKSEFVMQKGFVEHDELPGYLADANIFVFASSCENMPNTLVEAMAGGLPIASSDRGPMPELLRDGGVYFDPERAESITEVVEQLIADPALRGRTAERARQLSEQYSWARCAKETWAFLRETAQLCS